LEIIETSETLSQSVSNSISNNHFPLILGGDHSIAPPKINGKWLFDILLETD
jgi:arginase